eukprot:COSAG02_NODE_43107_length_378_cov_0.637993_1_plen_64_part_10
MFASGGVRHGCGRAMRLRVRKQTVKNPFAEVEAEIFGGSVTQQPPVEPPEPNSQCQSKAESETE